MKTTQQERDAFADALLEKNKTTEERIEALKHLSNELPQYMERLRIERILKRRAMKKRLIKITVITALGILICLLASCKTYHVEKYKVSTPNGNFYVDDIKFVNDSVYMVELNRGGQVRRNGAFKQSEIKINN